LSGQVTAQPPPELTDWLRRPWTPGCGRKAAHPNARFTVSAHQCPVLAKEYHHPRGVPISAILFGGRRATVLPLVHEARSWNHGVFMGSAMSSETTHAAAGQTGVVRRDPFAMLPFCGYHMGDYFAHWLKLGAQADPAKLPRIFYVNWYRKGAQGEYLWPGFGENSRVLKWIFERVNGSSAAVETPIGAVPAPDALDVSGLRIAPQAVQELLRVDVDGWLAELPLIREHYARFGERLPKALRDELATLEQRLRAAK
jgi:phosphoenolpyruvate carboxykinase (GTP)